MKEPIHISFICDGNGRWATQQNLNRFEGHNRGGEVIVDTIKSIQKTQIPYLSFFVFSAENKKRPKKEVDYLINLMVDVIDKYEKEFIDSNLKLNFFGDLSLFPDKLQNKLGNLKTQCQDKEGLTVLFFLNYGGKQDIIYAIKNYLQDKNNKNGENLTEEVFSSYLYTKGIPEPDILIRTGGEKRLSNFFLWQISYTELFFIDTLWPDFDEKNLKTILEEFSKRKRQFGNIL